MRSGNGRHRRPRQAPALVVAAGVTGSAMALPLLATGSASAADATTWDRVAECESGGAWSANFGNGLYGGLQFSQESWERHGGLAYAPSADLASRAQQITIADRALAAGDTQWATCAPIAGLENDGKAPAVNPGPGVTPKKSTGPVPESNRTDGLPAGSGQEGGKPSTAPTAPTAPATSVTPANPTTPAPPTPGTSTSPVTPGTSVTPGTPGVPTTPGTPGTPGTPAAPGTTAPGTGKHRGDAAPEEPGNSDTSTDSGRHAAPGDEVTGGVTDGKTAGNSDTTDKAGEYTVQPGDSLSGIAEENGLTGGWSALYGANKKTVGSDPDLILPGQSLELDLGLTESQK
ncbi:transglycosylase family protein [Streptomyces sp. NPDC056069]|uniref:LysM peptidoglycan-binding domain-containing protein n=1 Tax=Streptomyces sp. NPDC056069 TaxID=3345702 RepID=UPI0035DA785B